MQNRENLTPLVRKMSVLTQPNDSTLIRADTQKFLKNLSFLDQKVRTSASAEPPFVRKMSALDKPPPP